MAESREDWTDEAPCAAPYRSPEPPASRWFFNENCFIDLDEVIELWLCTGSESRGLWGYRLRGDEAARYWGPSNGAQAFAALRRYRGAPR